jgi:hypothetical protein
MTEGCPKGAPFFVVDSILEIQGFRCLGVQKFRISK